MAASKLAGIAAFAVAFALSFQFSRDVFAADEPIRLGVLNDQSGLPPMLRGLGSAIAARLAIEDFGGRVLGRPIELLVGDHQNKTDLAGTTTRRWIDVDNVVAILDGGTSAAALVIQQIAREKERVVMFSGPATSDLTGKACSPFGFIGPTIHTPWQIPWRGLSSRRGMIPGFFLPATMRSVMPSNETRPSSSRAAAARSSAASGIR